MEGKGKDAVDVVDGLTVGGAAVVYGGLTVIFDG